ncbi:MAG: YjjG family noncanonical pyrimidine nucleotidase [Clostridia bacterium]|nr:YjjG family noncanonical pyrimidine nucleotidase [Clostridia bacterium]
MSNTRFDTILLDADETIFDFLQAEKISLLDTAEKFGISATDSDAKKYSEINLSLWKKLELGAVSREELKVLRFKEWFDYMGVENICADDFCKHYEQKLGNTGILLDGALDFVQKLSMHCNVYIVTNGTAVCQEGRMKNSPVREYIKGMYISEKIGFSKPDKRYFDYVFKDIGITDFSRVIIVGDSLSSDMQGGKNAGIATCLYLRNEDNPRSDLCDYAISEYSAFWDILFN